MSWWTLHEETLQDALEEVAKGTPPEVVFVELLAGVKTTERYSTEGDNGETVCDSCGSRRPILGRLGNGKTYCEGCAEDWISE